MWRSVTARRPLWQTLPVVALLVGKKIPADGVLLIVGSASPSIPITLLTSAASIVPYKAFKTKDGDVLFGGGNDRLFGLLCDGLGKPEWKDDPKFKINSQRVANRDELESEIEKVSTQKTTQEWLDVFEGSGMPYAAVNDVQGTLNHEHTQARNMVIEVDHEDCGPMKLVNTPMKFSESQPGFRSPPPSLGQHTDEVLKDQLGLDEPQILELKAKGVVR